MFSKMVDIAANTFAYVVGVGTGIAIIMLTMMGILAIYMGWYYCAHSREMINKVNKSVDHYMATGELDEDAPDWLKIATKTHKIKVNAKNRNAEVGESD